MKLSPNLFVYIFIFEVKYLVKSIYLNNLCGLSEVNFSGSKCNEIV